MAPPPPVFRRRQTAGTPDTRLQRRAPAWGEPPPGADNYALYGLTVASVAGTIIRASTVNATPVATKPPLLSCRASGVLPVPSVRNCRLN